MKKLLTAFFVLGSFSLPAQTLFHYGDDSVSAKEFLKAYQKNNTGITKIMVKLDHYKIWREVKE